MEKINVRCRAHQTLHQQQAEPVGQTGITRYGDWLDDHIYSCAEVMLTPIYLR